ncbi:3-hydroxy-9,10-secoandrosta-1,3,5(10)-triene-9,17-dione monooxygenase reductase subunit [Nocardia sp. NPDC050193]
MPSSVGVSSGSFRNVLGHFGTGVVVITAFAPTGEPVGFACQSFAALSLDPPLVLFCPVKGSRSWAAIEAAGTFCVNVLTAAQQPVCARFGNRSVPDKFADTAWHRSAGGLPVLDDALATIECSVCSVTDGGDHWIVVGRVQVLAASTSAQQRPLLFYRGGYASLEPAARPVVPWRADLEYFLTTTTFDSWL